jgi:hypothetical protein
MCAGTTFTRLKLATMGAGAAREARGDGDGGRLEGQVMALNVNARLASGSYLGHSGKHMRSAGRPVRSRGCKSLTMKE